MYYHIYPWGACGVEGYFTSTKRLQKDTELRRDYQDTVGQNTTTDTQLPKETKQQKIK